MAQETFLIVGAGQAGAQAAQALREHGFGGRIVLVGDESWRPYERPPLSKDVLLAPSDDDCFKGWMHEAQFYEASAVELRGGAVARLDTGERVAYLADGQALPYDKCLLATGGRARQIDQAPCGARIVSLRTLDDAMRLRGLIALSQSVAVIGGGFLGLEFAASASKRGLRVTVFEQAARLLPRALPAAAAEKLRAKHEAQGVRIVLDSGALRIEAGESDVVVAGKDADAARFDFCVIAVGQVPNDAVARASGIETGNGIVVDQYCRTSAEHVYAAGDCANFPFGGAGHPGTGHPGTGQTLRLESWQNAQQQAIAAARNMLGESSAYRITPWFWTDQYDWNIQMLGLLDAGIDRWIERPGADEKAMLLGLRGNVIVYALAVNQGGDLRAIRRLVEQAVPVDPEQLADANVKLRQIERQAH
jgi:3-phenylpropionate/trans-cinnamate dioxygenase ferredoxin reductase subunit